MRTIDQSQCKHDGGSFPRDLRERYLQYFISKNKRKHKIATKNHMSRTIIELILSVERY
jgi:hypothetical protein